MEVSGLILGGLETVVQLARMVRGHVIAIPALHTAAESNEQKAFQASSAASQLNALGEVPFISAKLSIQTLQEVERVQSKQFDLVSVVASLFRDSFSPKVPAILREMNEIGSRLARIELLFRVVWMVSALVSTQHSMVYLNILENAQENSYASLSVLKNNTEQLQHLYFKLCSGVLKLTSPLAPMKNQDSAAEFNFAIGYTEFQYCTGGIVCLRTELAQVQRAARHFRIACQLGKVEAHRSLGDIYYLGYAGEVDFPTAVHVYREGVRRGDVASKCRLALCYELGHGVDVCAKSAIRLLTEAANEGCGESMFVLGTWKLHGKKIQTDYGTAVRLLRKAVDLGVHSTKGHLGVCYDKGIGFERDSVRSFQLLRETFEAGCLWSTVDLACCYDSGIGVEKNPSKATEVYEKCISAGTWHGDFYKALYGLRLINGVGVAKDTARGKAIILDSISDANAIPWFVLGECHRYGYGFVKNKIQAKRYYLKAAKCESGIPGMVGAYEALGSMFEAGDGVEASVRLSSRYYLSAADKLSQVGQWKVANQFECGRGLAKNVKRAVYYYKLCANSGHIGAQRKTLSYYMAGHGLERPRIQTRRTVQAAARERNETARHFWSRCNFM